MLIDFLRKFIDKWWHSIELVFILITLITTTVFSFLTYNWSRKTYKQLLPNEKSSLVFSDSEFVVSCMDAGCLLRSVMKNVGKGAAENIHFKLYQIPFEPEIQIYFSNPAFNDKIINSLYPQTDVTFGSTSYPLAIVDDKSGKKISIINKQIVLLYLVEYHDTIENRDEKVSFWFQYPVGQKGVFSALTKEVQNKIGVERLRVVLKDEDEWVLDDLK